MEGRFLDNKASLIEHETKSKQRIE